MKKFLNESWLVLVMGVVFAGMLAGTQVALSDKIEANKQAALEQAVFDVVPGAERFDALSVTVEQVEYAVYKCFNEAGEMVGWALPHADYGFQDKVRLVVGLSVDGSTVTGLKVVENTETPGLGNKIEDDTWRSQYAGKDASSAMEVVKGAVNDEAHEIQAITGATISSVAVTKIANDIIARIRPQLDELR